MPASHPSPLLAELRKRSAAVRDADPGAQRPGSCDLRDIDRRLLAAFRWLDEAIAHLEVIRPVVAHHFTLAGAVTISAPRYDRGIVSYRRAVLAGFDLIERLELYYRMAGGEPIRVEVPPGAAAAMEERLRGAQLDFSYVIDHDDARRVRRGVFTVVPAVMAAIRFVPDYDRGVVVANLRNVDRLEPVTLEFAPEAIGEPVLEDLVRLMLGEANDFLKRAPLAGVGTASTRGAAVATLAPSRYGRAAK